MFVLEQLIFTEFTLWQLKLGVNLNYFQLLIQFFLKVSNLSIHQRRRKASLNHESIVLTTVSI